VLGQRGARVRGEREFDDCVLEGGGVISPIVSGCLESGVLRPGGS
jgi:hypothetical protein